MKDMFGVEIVTVKKYGSKYLEFKGVNNYRKSDNKEVRCKTCEYYMTGDYHTKTLHKCELLGVSHSEATDLRVNNVCDKWELEIKE